MVVLYASQKLIRVHKREIKDDFLQVENEDWLEACRNLNGVAFKLYMYMASNIDGCQLILSARSAVYTLNISDASYRLALSQMQEKGYLVPCEDDSYDFYVCPRAAVRETARRM